MTGATTARPAVPAGAVRTGVVGDREPAEVRYARTP
ncbi:hypothetical protein J2S66_000683 [Saccharothrix longispora]|uniref:Uncharacterized protein n=1 Tax=Saccharothrix longispora TaxID=33920 RepID=A0ABU1PQE0_9PSEU|nr:hypothetical protein [Saccharothrix longispora]